MSHGYAKKSEVDCNEFDNDDLARLIKIVESTS
jgi:hypothetical protein